MQQCTQPDSANSARTSLHTGIHHKLTCATILHAEVAKLGMVFSITCIVPSQSRCVGIQGGQGAIEVHMEGPKDLLEPSGDVIDAPLGIVLVSFAADVVVHGTDHLHAHQLIFYMLVICLLSVSATHSRMYQMLVMEHASESCCRNCTFWVMTRLCCKLLQRSCSEATAIVSSEPEGVICAA